ncbi:unnamed protein product [Heligmosomoides polygyrus]|uniref:Nuclear pore complex protein Nup98-Nup96 n=1 Tax=Heligmosomoides polygyrus TaxID=6339 RepID=A0A3P7YST9_HELPZ|nr:unnamed protein product [Heligmosomoides polygyrus]
MFGQNKPTTSLFGQQSTTTQGSLFGQKPATNLFGQSTPTVFIVSHGKLISGSSQPATNTGTSLFGQSKPSLFGGSSTTGTTSLFGGSSTSTGGLFGSSTSTVNGTTVKFEPLVSSDTMMKNGSQTTIQTKHMCITAMKAYEGKSIEELRIEDYIANRKAPTTTGGLFGGSTATNTGGSIFGSTAAKPSLFGSSTSRFSVTIRTSLFGQNNNATQGSSLFGAKPTGSIFGSPAASTGSTFGSTTGGSLFGGTTGSPQQQTGSLFGGSTFGSTPATTSGFTFGSTTNTVGGQICDAIRSNFSTTSPFGQPATSTTGGGLFGSSTATSTGGSLFGAKPAGTGTFSFGGGTNTSFASGGGLFGNTQKPGGFFGSNTGTGSLFGSQPAQQSTGLFGSTQPAQTSLFGGNTANQQAQANTGSSQQFLDIVEELLPLVCPTEGQPFDFVAQNLCLSVIFSHFQVADSVRSSPRVRSPAIPGRDLNYTSKVAPPTLGKGIRTKSLNSSNSITNRSLDGIDTAIEASLANGTNMPTSGRRRNLKHLDLSTVMQVIASHNGSEADGDSQGRDPDELPPLERDSMTNNAVEVAMQRGEARRNGEVPRLQLDGSGCEESMMTSNKSPAGSVVTSSSSQAIVRLNSPDYFTEPTINAMREMVVDGKVVLNNGLTIGRATYGSVFWPGRIELENVALDEIVIFRHKEVTVYPDESKKPPLGEGLNRPAEVTLERVWHIDRNTKEEIRDPLKLIDLGWRDRLEKVTARMGATFKDYRPATGSWVFRVEHFSKYGLPVTFYPEVFIALWRDTDGLMFLGR